MNLFKSLARYFQDLMDYAHSPLEEERYVVQFPGAPPQTMTENEYLAELDRRLAASDIYQNQEKN